MPALTNPIHPLAQVRADVDATLERFLAGRRLAAHHLHPDYGRLWEVLSAITMGGGKRLRPYLVCLSYQGYGGQDYDGVIPIAAAVELLHNSMLIHDDIIDRDTIRHSRPNVSGSYLEIYGRGMRHHADGAALLAGDLALSAAYELALSSSLPAEARVSAMEQLAQMIFIVVGGELLDTEATLGPLAAADTGTIIELKSAHYSFIGPLTLGGMLAGAPKAQLQQLSRYGRALGSAYQLVDDVLGLFGDESKTGKSITSDLEEGKPTYLMQQTVAHASEADRHWLERTIGQGSITAPDAERVRELVISTGARQATGRLIDDYAAAAQQSLGDLTLTAAAREALDDMIDLIVGRHS
jgi:geranylgeranyl pyrophosphate synthase